MKTAVRPPKHAAHSAAKVSAQPPTLAECLAEVNTPAGRAALAAVLAAEPYPHYEALPGQPGLLIRTEANGRRTTGRFVGRDFNPVT